MTAAIVAMLLVVLAIIAWLLALELRFHSLKDIATESRELADEAAADARNALNAVIPKRSKR